MERTKGKLTRKQLTSFYLYSYSIFRLNIHTMHRLALFLVIVSSFFTSCTTEPQKIPNSQFTPDDAVARQGLI